VLRRAGARAQARKGARRGLTGRAACLPQRAPVC
jgi:hypothetical protein